MSHHEMSNILKPGEIRIVDAEVRLFRLPELDHPPVMGKSPGVQPIACELSGEEWGVIAKMRADKRADDFSLLHMRLRLAGAALILVENHIELTYSRLAEQAAIHGLENLTNEDCTIAFALVDDLRKR